MLGTIITIEAKVKASIENVWKSWTEPEHITQWNAAAPEWHCPKATNDFREGGKFSYTMAARDGSVSFDLGGTYTKIKHHEVIEYSLDDDRKVKISFKNNGAEIHIIENFEAEGQNSVELQKFGWQSILNNYKKHTEEKL